MRPSARAGWSGGTDSGRSILRALFIILLLTPTASLAADLFVNNVDPTCGGPAPCYSSIQKAIDAALPGDRVQVQAGTYRESVRIRRKNRVPAADDTDRIVIDRFDDSAPGSVVLTGGRSGKNCGTAAIEFLGSSHVTVRGLVITGAPGAAIKLHGGINLNVGIRLERNRIFDNGKGSCGAIVIESGNTQTLVANNLVYANHGNGVELPKSLGRATAPQYVIQNTIHGNEGNGIEIALGRSVVLANNAMTGNGALATGRPVAGVPSGYGVARGGSAATGGDVSLWNNLLCGNGLGEVWGPVFAGSHGGNLTPTGSEAAGIVASPECESPDGVYEDAAGHDGLPGSIDDDFALTLPGDRGLPSPAIDRGIAPRTLPLEETLYSILDSDFRSVALRPIQRDNTRPLDYDIGALELACGCATNCESCHIRYNSDGTSEDQCSIGYDSATQCCNRITGEIDEKHIGSAYESCPETRVAKPGFDPEGSADGCSAVPDHPLVLCPSVRFGCNFDAGEEDCPAGIDLPCNNHDFCYQTCGKTKAGCDLAFNDDMIDVCNDMTAGQKILCYDDCLLAVATYFDGVAVGAEQAFVNGQNRACQCCLDVDPLGEALP